MKQPNAPSKNHKIQKKKQVKGRITVPVSSVASCQTSLGQKIEAVLMLVGNSNNERYLE